MKYEILLEEAFKEGLIVKEKPLKYNDGRIKGNKVAIRKNIETNTKKACVLAEELGHHFTTVGDILNQDEVSNRKQERVARGWAYNKLVPLEDIKHAYRSGYIELYEMAEYLEVDESFLKESLEYYQQKYGPGLFQEKEADMLSGLLKILEERT